jgi:hypothetical protein
MVLSDYPLPRFGQGAFRLSVETVYKVCTLMHQQSKAHSTPNTSRTSGYDWSFLAVRTIRQAAQGDLRFRRDFAQDPSQDVRSICSGRA